MSSPPDTDLQAKIDAEKGDGKPASPELCAALGIDPKDLPASIGPTGKPTLPQRRPATERPGVDRELLARAEASLKEEAIRTKEAVLTTVATYLANKEPGWWRGGMRDIREIETDHLVRALVKTYKMMED